MPHKADRDQSARAANRHLPHLISTPLTPSSAWRERRTKKFSGHRLHFMQNCLEVTACLVHRYLILLLNKDILSISCCLLFMKSNKNVNVIQLTFVTVTCGSMCMSFNKDLDSSHRIESGFRKNAKLILDCNFTHSH